MNMPKILILFLLLLASPALAASQSTGLTFASPDELRGVPLAATPFSGTELPARVDLSAHMPPPGNQGHQNSCVGWATAYALKSYQEKMESQQPLAKNGKPDPHRVFSPAWIYNQINNGRDGGSRFIDALNLLSQQGAVSWAQMPYTERDYLRRPSASAQNEAKRYRIDYWRQVNVHDTKELKAHLNAGYPVLIGAMIDEGFQAAGPGYIWNQHSGKGLGGHAMALVGYDDQKQAFKLINSWGQNWGERGFGWISYRFLPQVVREAYVAKDAISGPAVPSQIKPSTTPNTSPSQTPYQPIADSATFSIIDVAHNLDAPAPEFQRYGRFMKIRGHLKVPAGAGQSLQVVIRFYHDDGQGGKGQPVRSKIPTIFELVDEGIAATGTPEVPLPKQGVSDTWFAYIPYTAFDVPAGKVNLVAEPMLYIDRFGIRNAKHINFWVQSEANQHISQTPTAAASVFVQAVYQQNYGLAWSLLSSYSRQRFLDMMYQETAGSISQAELVAHFQNPASPVFLEFWNAFRANANIEAWVNQTYQVIQQQNQEALIQSSNGQQILMKQEPDGWKFGFAETFLD